MSDNRPNIWRLQALADVEGLIKALEHDDPDIRQRAAVALRTLSAFGAIPALRLVLSKENNPDARTIITAALVHLLEEQQEQAEEHKAAPPPDEVTLLLEQLNSKNSNEAIHAAQALGVLGDPLAVEPLMALFNNREMPANVRLAAAEALIELKSPPTVVTALVALRRPNAHLRRIAAAMLSHLEADWAVEPLRVALKDENELVRRTARAALKHIGTPDALHAIESMPEPEPAPAAITASTQEAARPVAAPPVQENAPSTTDAEPIPESTPSSAAAQTVAPTPEGTAEDKPEWSQEKTRPTRPAGLDAAARADDNPPATPPITSPLDSISPASNDGAVPDPEAQDTLHTQG